MIRRVANDRPTLNIAQVTKCMTKPNPRCQSCCTGTHCPNSFKRRGSGGFRLWLRECLSRSARQTRQLMSAVSYNTWGRSHRSFPARMVGRAQIDQPTWKIVTFLLGLLNMPPRCLQGVSQLPPACKMSLSCLQMPPRCPHDFLFHDSPSMMSFSRPLQRILCVKELFGSCAGVIF